MAWRLGNAHIAWNDRPVDFVFQMRAHIVLNLVGQIVAPVMHGQDDTLKFNRRVNPGADRLDCAHDL